MISSSTGQSMLFSILFGCGSFEATVKAGSDPALPWGRPLHVSYSWNPADEPHAACSPAPTGATYLDHRSVPKYPDHTSSPLPTTGLSNTSPHLSTFHPNPATHDPIPHQSQAPAPPGHPRPQPSPRPRPRQPARHPVPGILTTALVQGISL